MSSVAGDSDYTIDEVQSKDIVSTSNTIDWSIFFCVRIQEKLKTFARQKNV